MFRIFGKFAWTKKSHELSVNDNTIDNGVMRIQIEAPENSLYAIESFYYDKPTSIYYRLIGYISNLDSLRNRFWVTTKSVSEMAGRLGRIGALHELDGVYCILIYDTKKDQCVIMQSEMGFGQPIYYWSDPYSFLFASRLKDILTNMKGERKLDYGAVRDFLHYQTMIPNESTLVEGVNKLIPNKKLVINCANHSFELCNAISIKIKTATFSNAKANLLDSIRICMQNITEQLNGKKIALALTSGWDSNLMLHYLRQQTNGSLAACTVRGGTETNETLAAKCIIDDNYSDVEHITASVEKNSVEALPELVWHYEGYLFEEGIFLRYELAKALKASLCPFVFLGVGADQMLFTETLLKRLLRDLRNSRLPQWKLRRRIKRNKTNSSYYLFIDFNIKMHEMMLNAFGMQGLYPFLNRKTSRLSRSLRIFLNWRKKYYKEKVRELLPSSIIKHIVKSGDVVDTQELFLANKKVLIGALKSPIVQKSIDASIVSDLSNNSATHHLFLMQLVYICLFNEVFITGKYDKDFGRRDFGQSLDQLLDFA